MEKAETSACYDLGYLVLLQSWLFPVSWFVALRYPD